MIQPSPGKTYLHNLVSTMIRHGNTRFCVDLNRIAANNYFTPDELADEFDRQAQVNSLAAAPEVEGK